MDTGEDGNAGSLMIGFDVALRGWDEGHAYGVVDYQQHILETPLGELSAFVHGFGGVTLHEGQYRPEIGVTGGLGLDW